MAIDKVPSSGASPWPRIGSTPLVRPPAGQATNTAVPAVVRPAEIDPLLAMPTRFEAPPTPAPATLHGVSAQGVPVAVGGLVNGGQGLSRGDVLLVQVQSTTPRLELGLFDVIARPAAGRSALFDTLSAPAQEPLPAAMRSDQLALRQLTWRLPEPLALATQWRLLVLNTLAQTAPKAHPAAAVTTAFTEPPLQAAMREAAPSPLLPIPDRWLYPAYAWGGLHAMLRVLEADSDPPPPPRRRQGRSLALRLEVDIPGLGRIAVLVQLADDGVQLLIFVEEPDALPRVRDVLPVLSSALELADLQLVRCRLVQGQPAPARAPVLMNESTPVPAAAWLSPPLFRAAAEVIVVFSAALAPHGADASFR